MTLNGSGIRDIHRVLGISIVYILFILRVWFKTLNEPVIKGHFKRVQTDSFRTDDWKAYKKPIPPEKHIIPKTKITHIERRNRDFRTHLKRLCRETVCFSKKDDMHYGIIKAYIFVRNKFKTFVKEQHTF